ncbi:MAG: helix-turn-helix domain-containing protein [Stenotrophobium sp.]
MELDEPTRALLRDSKKRRSWVIFQLQLRDQTLAGLASANGVTRQCLYHVFTTPYPHMEKLVADALGLTPETLFAERYDSSGRSLRCIGRPRKFSCHEKNHKSTNAALCDPGFLV